MFQRHQINGIAHGLSIYSIENLWSIIKSDIYEKGKQAKRISRKQ